METIAAQRRAQARASSTREASIEPTPLTDGSPLELEEEAEQQGAFNEETGEINWDCPCLGGMADGPCGEQFKAAFSCFVFSKEEPKGIDCIEHFKTMQNCFREHPDVYGSELEPDDADVPAEESPAGVAHAANTAREHVEETVDSVADNIAAGASAVVKEAPALSSAGSSRSSIKQSAARKAGSPPTVSTTRGPTKTKDPVDEGDEPIPRAWHDSTSESTAK